MEKVEVLRRASGETPQEDKQQQEQRAPAEPKDVPEDKQQQEQRAPAEPKDVPEDRKGLAAKAKGAKALLQGLRSGEVARIVDKAEEATAARPERTPEPQLPARPPGAEDSPGKAAEQDGTPSRPSKAAVRGRSRELQGKVAATAGRASSG